jgi:putative membrane protein
MLILSIILVSLVTIEHVYILIMEMFLWTKPRTLKVFGLEQEFAEQTKSMAANQGLYNGFLAAGLAFGLLHTNNEFGLQLQMFFLTCVLIAAVYGGLTVKRSILFVQGVPAFLALLSLQFI